MPSSTFDLTSLGTTATLAVEGTSPPEVQVTYDGRTPPLELFGHLRALGFAGLVPQPPPSSAIDWTRPAHDGAVTGFTLRPYRAVSRGRLEVPRDVRPRAIDATRYLLERMALDLRADTASPWSDGSDAIDTASEPISPSPATSVPPSIPATPTPWSRGGAGRDLIEVTVAAEHAAAARPVLAAIGELVGEAPTSWTTAAVYRGQPMETRHLGTGFVVEIAKGDRPRLVGALTGVPVRAVRASSPAPD